MIMLWQLDDDDLVDVCGVDFLMMMMHDDDDDV